MCVCGGGVYFLASFQLTDIFEMISVDQKPVFGIIGDEKRKRQSVSALEMLRV